MIQSDINQGTQTQTKGQRSQRIKKKKKGDKDHKKEKKQAAISKLQSMNSVLKNPGQKNNIRQSYGIGSKTIINRKKQKVQAMQKEATKSFLIQAVFKR